LESNWRRNVSLTGLSEWGVNLAEHGQRIPYVAEFVTPVPLNGFLWPWMVALHQSGRTDFYLGRASLLTYIDRFALAQTGGTVFPAAWGPYVPDNT